MLHCHSELPLSFWAVLVILSVAKNLIRDNVWSYVIDLTGKEGVLNNAFHKWYLKPGKYDKNVISGPPQRAMSSRK